MKTERELFEKAIVDKCGFNPETSFELSSVTGDYKSDVVYFAWLMWQASTQREGYKLVPVEPTTDMWWEGKEELQNNGDVTDIYKAMIGAAP